MDIRHDIHNYSTPYEVPVNAINSMGKNSVSTNCGDMKPLSADEHSDSEKMHAVSDVHSSEYRVSSPVLILTDMARESQSSESLYEDTADTDFSPEINMDVDDKAPFPPLRLQSDSNQSSYPLTHSASYSMQSSRSPSYSPQLHRIKSNDTYTIPMESQASAFRCPPVPRNTDISKSLANCETSSTGQSPNLHFSYDDMSREQLLVYVKAIQNSQSTYLQPNQLVQSNTPVQKTSTSYYPVSTNNTGNVNVTSDVFKLADEIPPPLLPPKQKYYTKSSEDIWQVPVQRHRKSDAVKKAHSVLLQGTSAEAVRQRYRYQGDAREEFKTKVKFELVESDEDISERCPPVPPRLHRSDRVIYENSQNFKESSQPKQLKRSHTVKAYLPSETQSRRKYNVT